MATITWSITSMTILPHVEAYYDFTWQANWKCTATDGITTQEINSSVTFFPSQQGQSYTPYDQLTEAQVVQWVKDSLGPETVAKTESVLTNMLTAQIAPLPWSN